jgi:hypothetical protein
MNWWVNPCKTQQTIELQRNPPARQPCAPTSWSASKPSSYLPAKQPTHHPTTEGACHPITLHFQNIIKRKLHNTHYRERCTFGPLITCNDTQSTLWLTHRQRTIQGSNQQTQSEWKNFIYGIMKQEVQLCSHCFLLPEQMLWCMPRGCQQGAQDDCHTTALSFHMGGSQLNVLIRTHFGVWVQTNFLSQAAPTHRHRR